jgi:hypothetical protein
MTDQLFPSAQTTDLSQLEFTLPEFTTFDQSMIAFAILFAIVGATANLLNIPFFSRNGRLFSYSKFAGKDNCCSSRFGMFFVYFPAFLLSLILATDESVFKMVRVFVVSVTLTIHFGKRCFEILFVHSYSGTMPFLSPMMIGAYYCMLSYINIHYAAYSAQVHDQPAKNVNLEDQEEFFIHAETVIGKMFIGLCLFVVGQIGNLYHHWLLSRLRQNRGETAYKVPMGGLFSHFGGAACPHYFFEIISWFGVSIITKHFVSLLFTIAMTCYLIERSIAQNQWNKSNLKDKYPKGRKNMIPLIF